MRKVNIKRADLIERVKANRDAHRAAFEKALDGYRRLLVRELEQRIADVKAGRRVERFFRLPEPSDHTDDYDRLLLMAEMSVDDVIELDDDDFARFVMDQWSWKNEFLETTAYYEGRQPRRAGARG